MPLFNDQIDVPEITVVAATAATITATDVADTDFSADEYIANLVVDGGAPQAIDLDSDYTDTAGLITALNSQTTGATWSDSSGTLILTSSSTGATSSLSWALVDKTTKDIFIADTDDAGFPVTGTDATNTPTTLFIATKGTVNDPEQIEIFNNEDASVISSPTLYTGGSLVTTGIGMPIKPGASQTIPLRAGDVVYAVAPAGKTVDTRILVTEQ